MVRWRFILKINYKKENKKYENQIIEYRKVTEEVRVKEKIDLVKSNHNKEEVTETPHEVLFWDVKINNLHWSQDPIELPNKTYSFVTFTNTKFGKKAILSEDDMYEQDATFWNVTFTNCEFQNIRFVNCRFFGCKFISCKTNELGIVFEDCYFCKTSIGHNELVDFETKIVSTEFKDCWITAKFRRCKMENFLWDNCTLMLTTFKECSLMNAIFTKCGFYSVVLNETDIAGMGIIKMKKADIEFYGNYKDSEFHKSTYIDLMSYKDVSTNKQMKKIDLRNSNKSNASDLSKMYYTLVNSLQTKNVDIDFLSEYRYQYQKHHMIEKDKWYSKTWDFVSWGLCGFGEKVFRFCIWLMVCAVVFAIGYMFTGIQFQNENIQYVFIGGNPFDFIQTIKDFGVCFHFSVLTLSTVGYEIALPLGNITHILTTIQSLLGLVFIAIFTSIMIIKLIRQ